MLVFFRAEPRTFCQTADRSPLPTTHYSISTATTNPSVSFLVLLGALSRSAVQHLPSAPTTATASSLEPLAMLAAAAPIAVEISSNPAPALSNWQVRRAFLFLMSL